MPDERRRRLRVPLHLQAEVRVEDEVVPVETLNISLKGLLCTSDARLRPGLSCQVRLHLGAEVSLAIKAVIIRSGDQETAIDFLSMDEESGSHLRRLVEYNAGVTDPVLPEMLEPVFPLRCHPRPAPLRYRPLAVPSRRSRRSG